MCINEDPFDAVVVFVLERPTKLMSYLDGDTALSDRLVPKRSKEYICVLYPVLNSLWLVRRYKTKYRFLLTTSIM